MAQREICGEGKGLGNGQWVVGSGWWAVGGLDAKMWRKAQAKVKAI